MTSSRSGPLSGALELGFAGDLSGCERALDRIARTADPLQVRWLRAYVRAAQGDFAVAERDARAILRRTTDPALRARAAVTLGSILRQTGRHADAGSIESSAVRSAPTAVLRAHLLVGLAADAVGKGDLTAVDRALTRASAIRTRDPRVAIRLRWVRCERELLSARPKRAVRWARSAESISRRVGARRHVAKSLLFLGAAQLELARRSEGAAATRSKAGARTALREARDIATRIGARPVARVAGELLRAAGHGR